MCFRCLMFSCQDLVSCYFYFVLLPLVVVVVVCHDQVRCQIIQSP